MLLMKVAEVARRLNCSEGLVYAAIAAGELLHYRLGRGQGGIRVSEAQLAAFLTGREKGDPRATAPQPRHRIRLRHLDV